jgi:3-methyladenine DNA glycosylase AlkD
MTKIIIDIRKELKKNSDEKTRRSGENFFKEKISSYGVKSAVVSRISKEYFKQVKDKSKNEIFALCEELWRSGNMEESFVACHWSYYLHEQFEPQDFNVFEKWVSKYVGNWASCDTLCNHTIGTLVEMYPQYIKKLKLWTRSKNRWVKRASAVTLIIPAKKGMFLKDIFDISDELLIDPDDMVQKGYGWMLKSASRLHQKEVFDYVLKHKKVMPRTALRYAIEKMPENLRKRAMEK